MEGVDIFDMKPLDASRKGTLKEPILVRSAGEEQYAGCTGYPVDSHGVIWLTVRRPPPLLPPLILRQQWDKAPSQTCAVGNEQVLTRSYHHLDHPRPPHRALPRVRQRLQDGVRRCPGRPPRPRPRPPRLRGAQELLRLRQARVLLGVAWPGLTRSGVTAVGSMDSRRRIPFQETTCTRGRRQAIQETFSRPKMSGVRPCRINSLYGRCIEVFFFCRYQKASMRYPFQPD